MGVKFPSGTGDDYDYYIAIFPDAFQSDKHLLCTIIHEMAHAMDAATETSFQPPHGPRFKKGAKSLMRSLGKVPSAKPNILQKLPISVGFGANEEPFTGNVPVLLKTLPKSCLLYTSPSPRDA